MNLQWFLAVTGALFTIAAVLWARHVTKRLERLSQSYWELRYEHGQLASRLNRLESPDEAGADPESTGAAGSKGAGLQAQVKFVPLSSLKK